MRPASELLEDPSLVFRIGQLVGAAEMAGHWMRLQGDEQVKAMGERLEATTAWWFTERKPDKWDRGPQLPPAPKK